MSETNKNVVSFETGKPLTDLELSHAESIAITVEDTASEQQGIDVRRADPDKNTMQEALRVAGGSRREGETIQDVRKRGGKRLVVGTLAAGAALSFGGNAVDAVKDYVADRAETSDKQQVQIMENYSEDGILDEGKIVVKFDTPGVAWDAGQELTSGENTDKLIDQIAAQTDVQLDPGINAGDIAVVDADLVNPASPYIVDQGPKQ